MTDNILRVWAEELEPENRLRLIWVWEDDLEHDISMERETISTALSEVDGVSDIEPDSEGLALSIDPALVRRPDLAASIREALGATAPIVSDPDEPVDIRIWAEDIDEEHLRLTWIMDLPDNERDFPSERRRVAAWLEIQPAIKRASLDDEGVLLRYDLEALDRRALGDVVRRALRIEDDLRTRANDLVRRAPAYGKLAQKLAVDERISPLPNAARQAASNRGQSGVGGYAARQTAMRFIPGAATIQRIQTLLPVIQELSTWSREASPEIVDGHLEAAGLDRTTLELDNATAHEVARFARDYAGEKAGEMAERAGRSARKAVDAGRDWLSSRTSDSSRKPDR